MCESASMHHTKGKVDILISVCTLEHCTILHPFMERSILSS